MLCIVYACMNYICICDVKMLYAYIGNGLAFTGFVILSNLPARETHLAQHFLRQRYAGPETVLLRLGTCLFHTPQLKQCTHTKTQINNMVQVPLEQNH